VEPKFYALLLDTLGIDPALLPDQFDKAQWPALCDRFAAHFKLKTRDEWCAIMEGTDICFAPVLSFGEAAGHFHNKARGSFVEVDGIVQPGPAPRFSRTPSSVKFGPPAFGAHTKETLKAWGFSQAEVETLAADKAIGRQARA
jgi:alpha-methylacyl-CoA racemase